MFRSGNIRPPKNVQKIDHQFTDHPNKSIYLKNHSLDSTDLLREVKWQWILKSDRSTILEKKSPSLLGVEMAQSVPEKGPFSKNL